MFRSLFGNINMFVNFWFRMYCIYTFSSRSAHALKDSCLFLESEEVFIQILCHLRNHRTAYFFTDSTKSDTRVRTILVDTCCPISGSSSTPFHLSQQTDALHALSPVTVLAFSSHLSTNDTVQRNHRMSLDPRRRLPIIIFHGLQDGGSWLQMKIKQHQCQSDILTRTANTKTKFSASFPC